MGNDMGYKNPLLDLPAGKALLNLPAKDRRRIELVMRDLRAQANVEAERSWKLRKGPMAAYFRAVSTYSRHLAHALSLKSDRTTEQDSADKVWLIIRTMCEEVGIEFIEGELDQNIQALASIQDSMRVKLGAARATLDAIANSLEDHELRPAAKAAYQNL